MPRRLFVSSGKKTAPNINMQPTAAPGTRIPSMDIVKGIAIILVVYGHVMQGMAHRNLIDMPFYTFSDTLIYSFHMPAFFFASGLFAKLNSNVSSSSLFTKKAQQLLWPYLLWEFINLLVYPFISKFTMAGTQPLVWKELLTDIVLGVRNWFLWTLFVVYVMAIFTRKVDRSVLLAVSLILYSIVSYKADILPVYLPKIFLMLPYFIISSRWSGEILNILFSKSSDISKSKEFKKWITGLFLFIFLIGSVAIQTNIKLAVWIIIATKFFQGLAGTLLLIVIAQFIVKSYVGGVLVKVGIASLAIFLLHPYFQGASRMLINCIAGESSSAIPISIIAQTTTGVWVSAIIYFATLRFGGKWLFHFPEKNKSVLPANVASSS